MFLVAHDWSTVSLLGRHEGYTVKYNPLPEGVPEGEGLVTYPNLFMTLLTDPV